ncbi:MAG TPA: SAM hydroxide adenosyltransferase [Candidatus Polarisedimenticolaceae bacterium]|nr:SAM hydroxide adenosyltransferase [Candidatus Polarisedimenticolaceae bacterium]
MLGVDNPLEAGVTIVDMLIAATTALGRQAHPQIIVANKATRGNKQNWSNGTPFCWFWYQENLVVSTLDDQGLSLVRHLDVQWVNMTDIPTVLKASDAWCRPRLTTAEKQMTAGTQFRSLWYELLLARWVWDKQGVPFEDYPLKELSLAPEVVAIDGFGNCKTSQPWDDLRVCDEMMVQLALRGRGEPINLICYEHLADVPPGVSALVRGSSGFGFAEIIVQQGNAAAEYHLKVGKTFEIIVPTPALVN